MVLQLYNTLTGRRETFAPISRDSVKMFVCGPTVYDVIHLGHARTFLFYDMLVRLLISKGYSVRFVMNITDLDDKVFAKARSEGVSYEKIAEKYGEAFFKDLEGLGVKTVTFFAKASDFVQESVKQVVRLVEKGYAYAADGTVFYNTASFSDYGKLSHQSPVELKLRRLDPDPRKKSQSDFILWRPSGKDEPSWATPFGVGRPGWHIEDTAISVSLLGERYDIHGGAGDLVFPHHEAEIAQAEALTGKKPFVKYWVHMGTLNVGGEKMSKSLRNFVSVRDALGKYDADTLRLYFCSCKYSRVMNMDERGLRDASAKALKIGRVASKLKMLLKGSKKGKKPVLEQGWKVFERRFYRALDDDMNTSKAVGELVDMAEWVNTRLKVNTSREVVDSAAKSFLWMCWIMGLSFVEEFDGHFKRV